ncbi:MAG: class I tRNA ligase family protein, partial [Patescibacteria group bacterium]
MENKFYITTPIYYASGKPHIGHAFTTIYADILARYHKSLGKEVFFSVGMDEHGAKIAEKAKEENKSPQEFVDEISKSYIDTWSALNIEYSDFIRTTSQKHKETVNEFIKKIYASGDIYEGIYEGLYCVGCEKFLTEKELENGACPDHLTVPQKIKEKNYFFNL